MFDVVELIRRTRAQVRPYQGRIVSKVVNAFTDGSLRSVLIESPTGSGKTVMALLIAKAMHEMHGTKIGWVAMRQHLLHQVQDENVAKDFNVPMHFISMFDKNPPTDIDMLIVDEAQHDVTASMGHIHALIEPKYILGLSATPFRADRVKLCFDKVVKDAGIATLIAEGYLSKYHHFTIPKWGVEEVTNHYIAERERWGKSIMYFHRLKECAQAWQRLTEAGVRCDVVSGAGDTEEQIGRFKHGGPDGTKVLLNCMKLTEGFDCPDLKTVFCRPSCKSVTVQMAGRVLRIHPDHPVKQIVQAKKTPYVFTKTALAVIQHVKVDDGSWRTLQVNPHIEQINQRTIRALAHTETEMPDFIKKATTFGNLPWRNEEDNGGIDRTSRRRGRRETQEDGSFAGESGTPWHHG
jgi:superfamily II DNA or RNA helicase